MHYFTASLAKGNVGEAQVLKLFAGLKKLDGRHGDLVLPDGGKVELKTDYYAHKPGGNFFIERYSDANVLSPGGPWQARAHGCQYFMYFFINSGTGYLWTTDNLLAQLEPLVQKLQPVYVKNKRWETLGFKVPRGLLKADLVFVTDGSLVNIQDGDVELLKLFTQVIEGEGDE